MQRKRWLSLAVAVMLLFNIALPTNWQIHAEGAPQTVSQATTESAVNLATNLASPVRVDATTYTFNVNTQAAPYNVANGKLFVIGSFNGWNTDTAVELKDNGSGVLSATINFLDYNIPSGQVQYKFRYQGTWDTAFTDPLNSQQADGNSVLTMVADVIESPVNVAGKTYTFNVNTQAPPYNSANGKLYVIGSFNGWNADTAVELVDNGKGVLTATIDFTNNPNVTDQVQYKFRYQGTWDTAFTDPLNSQQVDGNSLIKLAPDVIESPVKVADKIYTFNVNTKAAPYNSANGKLFVIGSFNGWNTETAVELIDNGKGVLTATVDFTNNPNVADQVQYKFRYQNTWDTAFTDPLNPNTSGGNSLILVGNVPDTVSYHLTGSFQGWAAGDDAYTMTDPDGDGIYTLTLDLASARYEYKVTKKVKGVISWIPDGTNNNHVAQVTKAGQVTFYFNGKLYEAGQHTHPIASSLDMKLVDVFVFNQATGEKMGQLLDPDFDGTYVYKFTNLAKGEYNFILKDAAGNPLAPEATPYAVNLKENFDLELAYYSGFDYLLDNYAPLLDGVLDAGAISHNSWESRDRQPFGAVAAGTAVKLGIATAKGDASKVTLLMNGKPYQMVLASSSDTQDFYTKTLTLPTVGVSNYSFIIQDGEKRLYYGGTTGSGTATDNQGQSFGISVFPQGYQTPDWMKLSITYQIFGDRFNNGDPTNDKTKLFGMGDIPLQFPVWEDYANFEDTRYQFVNPDNYNRLAQEKGWDKDWHNDMYGGDLAGVSQKLDYLQSLGVKTIYFNPMFESISAHKYDSADYSKVDPRFGSNTDFEVLAREAKSRGMHIILDGVFNHVGSDSLYFNKFGKNYQDNVLGAYEAWILKETKAGNPKAIALYDSLLKGNSGDNFRTDAFYQPYLSGEKEIKSPYSTWFAIKADGLYEGWWGYDSLPVIQSLDGSELNVKDFSDYIIRNDDSIARQWLARGASGWRLDVSPEVSMDFWQELRNYIKGDKVGNLNSPNGEPIILAENWGDATSDFLSGAFDSTMNYRFREAAIEFVIDKTAYSKYDNTGQTPEETWIPSDAATLNRDLMLYFEKYPKESSYVLMNLLGSHDVPRILGVLGYVEVDRPLYPATINDIAKDLGIDVSGHNIMYVNDLVTQNLTTSDALKIYLDARNAKARSRFMQATLLQMTYPGSPTVYYGDEVGMSGYHDPDNRRAFNWSLATPQNDVLNFTTKVAGIRNQNLVLQTGDFTPLMAEAGSSVYAFGRVITGEADALGNTSYVTNYETNQTLDVSKNNAKAVVALNKDAVNAVSVSIPVAKLGIADGERFKDALSGQYYVAASGGIMVTVPAQGGVILLPTADVAVTGLVLEKASATIFAGETVQLNGVVQPENATVKGIKWVSSDETVATVDQKGLVTGVAAPSGNTGGTAGGTDTVVGTTADGGRVATITATTEEGGFIAQATVTVMTKTKVTGLTIAKALSIINRGATTQLIAGVTPVNATEKSVIWSSNNVRVASVNGSGLVKGSARGIAVVTGKTVDGGFTSKSVVMVQSTYLPLLTLLEIKGDLIKMIGELVGNQTQGSKDYMISVEKLLKYKIFLTSRDVKTILAGATKLDGISPQNLQLISDVLKKIAF